MCFSPEASFGLGAVLLPAGAYCVRTALKQKASWLPLGITPLLLGVQQVCEGLVWVGLRSEEATLVRPASLVFLFFGLAVWPFWMPVAAACIESRPAARRVWFAMAVLGLGWLVLLYLPILHDPDRYLTTRVEHHSIAYEYAEVPVVRAIPPELFRLLYAVLGGLPLIACSDGRVRLFGILLGVAAVVSRLMFVYAFASVWCFFAAALSFYLCYALTRRPNPHGGPPLAA
ncbi:MAG: hypothetical protein HYS12_02340 [Planctomycetes bacterium]|nr:hypothetical protein [Planctomycetota bacterium]